MAPAPKLSRPKFEFTLTSSDLPLSTSFYTKLLGVKPHRTGPTFAEFDVVDPPLTIALHAAPTRPGGALNHVGLRLPDSADLVEVQRRLELGGVSTIRQDGVECCYARQNKFWATDPDAVLWELYTVEEDLDHSGFVDPPLPPAFTRADDQPEVIWPHMLSMPIPERIPHDDATVDEVRLTGTLNAILTNEQIAALLAEAHRVLIPGGKVSLQALVSNIPLPFKPQFPPPASQVEHVPVEHEPVVALRGAGFTSCFFEILHDVTCIAGHGVELRHLQLSARKPLPAPATEKLVVYLGPFAEVIDDAGTVYRCGVPTKVSSDDWRMLSEKFSDKQFSEVELT